MASRRSKGSGLLPRCVLLLTLNALGAGQTLLGMEPAALFSTDEPLIIDLFADLQALCDNPDRDDCPDSPALIAYRDGEQREHRIEARLRIRGRWQAHTSDCTLPSLFLVFDGAAASGTVFERQSLLPLTTHCRTQGRYEQYLLKEYLAHRLYNLLTDKSLSLRLARITYHDTSSRSEPLERYGFFTEHFQSLADRFDAEVFDPGERFDHLSADGSELATLSLFQYMIGNTDWSIVTGHNITYIRGTDWVTAVPFDLDYSGLVDAGYAGPPPGLNLRTIRQRLYRGFCRPQPDWPAVFERFTSRRALMLDLVARLPGLSQSYRRRTADYLESFFEILDSPAQRERRIVAACRSAP